MLNLLENIIYFVSIFSTFSLGLFVFLNDRRGRVNRIFFASILTATGWLISLFLFYSIESPTFVLWIGRINFAFVLPLLYYLFNFSIIFPKEVTPSFKSSKAILGLWILLFTAITLLTPLVSEKELIAGPSKRETVYGLLYPLYILHYIVFASIIVTLLFSKIRRCKEKIEKYQLLYVLTGLFLALFFGFTTNILLPLLGIFKFQNYGPLATVIFSGFITIAILKHYLFNIKVIGTELFTALLVLVLLINIFNYDTVGQLILNIVIFAGTALFGIFLIRSVLQEVKTREEMEGLARRLEKANIELRKLDWAKTEFMSMASHQLRTPLTAIKGYVSLALEGQYGKVAGRLKMALSNVFVSNERLIKIVRELLTISRAQMGKLTVKKEPTRIEEVIRSCIEEMKLEAQKKRLMLAFKAPKVPLPKIKIDRLKIRQAILNIIDNAIKYTQKGSITIRAERRGEVVRITIKDTGEGLNQEEKQNIFESFIRGRAGTTFFIEGTGLGLHVAKRFVELHKGRIWAESEGEGRGSTFIIELPLG